MNKLIILIITRVIEFIVIGVVVSFLWGAIIDPTMRITAIFAGIGAYCVYLGVTLTNDVRIMRFGEGEPQE